MLHIAKLFKNGRSQAVRLPAECRFKEKEVFIRRDPATGDVVLSRRPSGWKEFFSMLKTLDIPDDFMADREQPPSQNRDPL